MSPRQIGWHLPAQTPRARPRRIEEPIQIGIVNMLRMALPPSWVVHHSPNGLKRTKAAGGRAKALGTLAGYPDIVIHGSLMEEPWRAVMPVTCFLEVKAPGGTTSGAQEGVLGRLGAHGFRRAIVTSVDQAIDVCRAWGLPLRIVQWGD